MQAAGKAARDAVLPGRESVDALAAAVNMSYKVRSRQCIRRPAWFNYILEAHGSRHEQSLIVASSP
jgi:hypothetical protein